MKYTLVRSAAVLMLGSLMVVSPNSANAGWGHLRGVGSSGGSSGGSVGSYAVSYGSSGGYGSYGSSGGYASYGSSGGYGAFYGSSGSYVGYSSVGGSSGGSSGGVLHRVGSRLHSHLAAKRARHAARRAAYGSSGGYYASSGGSSGSSGSYASYGSSGGVAYRGYRGYYGGSSGGAVSYGSTGSLGSTGNAYYGTSKRTAKSAASVVSKAKPSDDAVYLTVAVPSDAKIFVNGNATDSTGAVRQFVSRGLKSGKSYRFEIRAELEGADGQVISEEKSLVVTAGKREQVQFDFAETSVPIETAVTLDVPEGAQVTLAGNPTKATGTKRTYRTSQLKAGQIWDDYQIQVRLGDEVKNQSVRLIAGDKLHLTFSFDETAGQLASR